MTSQSDDPVYRERVDSVVEAIESAGAGGAVISAPADVAALAGIWIETGMIIAGRDPWLLVAADGRIVLVVDRYEVELARARCQIQLSDVLEYSGLVHRQDLVVAWATKHGWNPVAARLADLSAADAQALLSVGVEVIDVGPTLESTGRRKSATEIARIEAAAQALTAATEHVCASGAVLEATEFELASLLAGRVLQLDPDWGMVVPIASSGDNLAVTHARPSERRLARGDLCRIGARGRYGPFHAMYVRSAVVDDDGLSTDSGELATLTATHAETIASLTDGAAIPLGYRDVPGHRLVPIPRAQGMGFRFKEAPTLGESPLTFPSVGDTLLASTILERPSGVRLYWQELVVAESAGIRRLGCDSPTALSPP